MNCRPAQSGLELRRILPQVSYIKRQKILAEESHIRHAQELLHWDVKLGTLTKNPCIGMDELSELSSS